MLVATGSIPFGAVAKVGFFRNGDGLRFRSAHRNKIAIGFGLLGQFLPHAVTRRFTSRRTGLRFFQQNEFQWPRSGSGSIAAGRNYVAVIEVQPGLRAKP